MVKPFRAHFVMTTSGKIPHGLARTPDNEQKFSKKPVAFVPNWVRCTSPKFAFGEILIPTEPEKVNLGDVWKVKINRVGYKGTAIFVDLLEKV